MLLDCFIMCLCEHIHLQENKSNNNKKKKKKNATGQRSNNNHRVGLSNIILCCYIHSIIYTTYTHSCSSI